MTEEIKPWLTLIGLSPAGFPDLSQAAKAALKDAARILGSQRQLGLIPIEIVSEAKREAWPSPMAPRLEELISQKPAGTIVLASGDPFFWGIGTHFAKYLKPSEMQVYPAPSILTLIAARMQWSGPEIKTISLCSQPLSRLASLLEPGRKIIALSANGKHPAKIAKLFIENGYGPSRLTVLENLGMETETITETTAERLHEEMLESGKSLSDLNSLAIELIHAGKTEILTHLPGLPVDAFNHDGQITRQNIRAITLAHLRPTSGTLLWDIGMGNGSISIEWLRAAPNTRAIGVEKNPDRLARALKNADRLGVPHLETRQGNAGAIIRELETPDAIFIGGGITEPGLLELALEALKPGGRLVANTVTLEGEGLLINARARQGGTLTRLSIENAEDIGSFQSWRAEMAITQWVWRK